MKRKQISTDLDEKTVSAALDTLTESIPKVLGDLVAFDSTRGSQGEKDIQAYLEAELSALGLVVEHVNVDEKALEKRFPNAWGPVDWTYDGRYNLVATHTPYPDENNDKGQYRSLLFNGHVDIVPIEQDAISKWTTPPFTPAVRGNRLYGRGSGDMKGGIVAALFALKILRSLGLQPAAPLYFQTVIEEECTGNGALAALAYLLDHNIKPDGVVIPEPLPGLTSVQLGVLWLQISVSGKPVHVLDTSKGFNAIEAAMLLYQQGLKPLEKKWNDPKTRPSEYKETYHPINFNLGKIEGGVWASSVACDCTLHVRVGFFPEMAPRDVKTQIEAALKEVSKDIIYSVKYIGFQAEGCVLEDTKSEKLFDSLKKAHYDIQGFTPLSIPATCTTDARAYHIYGGFPTTCYGPSASNIHGIDESVDLDSLHVCIKTLTLFIARWCGVQPLIESGKSQKGKS